MKIVSRKWTRKLNEPSGIFDQQDPVLHSGLPRINIDPYWRWFSVATAQSGTLKDYLSHDHE
jgi:hypothetical protein